MAIDGSQAQVAGASAPSKKRVGRRDGGSNSTRMASATMRSAGVRGPSCTKASTAYMKRSSSSSWRSSQPVRRVALGRACRSCSSWSAAACRRTSSWSWAATCSRHSRRGSRNRLWLPHTGAPHAAHLPIANVPQLQLSRACIGAPEPSWYLLPQGRYRTWVCGASMPSCGARRAGPMIVSYSGTIETHSQYPGAIGSRFSPPHIGQPAMPRA